MAWIRLSKRNILSIFREEIGRGASGDGGTADLISGRCFDVAFEKNTGNAICVFNGGTGGSHFYYAVFSPGANNTWTTPPTDAGALMTLSNSCPFWVKGDGDPAPGSTDAVFIMADQGPTPASKAPLAVRGKVVGRNVWPGRMGYNFRRKETGYLGQP